MKRHLVLVIVLSLFALAACSSDDAGPPAADLVVQDRQLLADLIASEPDLLGPQFQPRIGSFEDRLLDDAWFLSAVDCQDPTGAHVAAAKHFTGFTASDGALSGSLDLWVATFTDDDAAIAFHNEAVQLWDQCVPAFNETNLLQVEPFAVAQDLIGDGSGMGGVSARITRPGSALTSYMYQVPSGRLWARIKINENDTALDPDADRTRILQAFWRMLLAADT